MNAQKTAVTTDKKLREAFEALMAMPPPQFDMKKVGKHLAHHNSNCGLCRLIFGRTK